MTDRYDWHDINYTALADPGEMLVAWRVVRIGAVDPQNRKPLYGDFTNDSADNLPENAPPTIAGTIKWDGCSDLTITDDDGQAPTHFCGADNVEELAIALRRIYSMTAWYLRDTGYLGMDGLGVPSYWSTQEPPDFPELEAIEQLNARRGRSDG